MINQPHFLIKISGFYQMELHPDYRNILTVIFYKEGYILWNRKWNTTTTSGMFAFTVFFCSEGIQRSCVKNHSTPNGPLTAIAGHFPATFFGLYKSASILSNPDFYFCFHSMVYSFSPVASSKPSH